MSKLSIVRELIGGSHVMGEDGLRDYHAARAVINATRRRDPFPAIREALKNHRVMVSYDGQGIVRIFRPDTGQKWFSGRKA